MNERKGLLLVLATALISGISIFTNSLGVQESNPFVFTFLKNAAVAVLLLSAVVLFKKFAEIKILSRKQFGQLAAIGLVGGSIPFLMFFYALKLTTPINAGFIHKTLFLWSALLALFLLKERISKAYVIGAALLLGGNFLFFNISSFGIPEALVLMATLLWAAENTISKHVLRELSGSVVAFGRMFFGSTFILLFLGFAGQLGGILEINAVQAGWIALSSVLLFGYVFTWYNGLRHIPLHKAAAVLTLAQPVTVLLSFAFPLLAKQPTAMQVIASLLVVAGVFLAIFSCFLQASKTRVPSFAFERN